MVKFIPFILRKICRKALCGFRGENTETEWNSQHKKDTERDKILTRQKEVET